MKTSVASRVFRQGRWFFPLALLAAVLSIRCGTAAPQTFASLSPDTEYVGSQACQPCHQKIFASYQKTGMGRSLYAPDPEKRIEDFGPAAIVYDRFLDMYYRPYWKEGRMFIEEFRLQGADTVYARREGVDFVVGSGHQTRSYLMQRNGYLYEMPITWYVVKGIWDLSPGYDNGHNSRFDREIGEECMACHTGNLSFVEGSKNRFEKFSLGIDCEQCHGPGSAHVEATEAGQLIDVGMETDYTIVNPAKLPLNLQFDVCQQCHLQGVNVYPEEQSVRDFRPGMALADVYHIFLEQPENPDAFGIASHAERLQQSACFIQSEGKLTCTTCHDPHKSIGETEKDVYVRQCESCHTGAMVPDCGESDSVLSMAEGNCITCHMPQRGTRDIPHVFFHDHKIRVLEDTLIPSAAEVQALADELHCATGDPGPDQQGKAFLRYFEEQRAEPVFLEKAEALLAPESRYARARLAYHRGNFAQAQALVEAELSSEGEKAYLHYLLADILRAQGQFVKAREHYEKTASLQPASKEAAFQAAVMLLKSRPGDRAVLLEARPRFTELLEVRPFDPRLHNNLGFIALNLGEFAPAQYHLEEALRLNPDYAQALESACWLAIQQGNLEKARNYYVRLSEVAPDRPGIQAIRLRLQ